MISIESYRALIGGFAYTAQRNVKSISKSIFIGSKFSKNAFSRLLKPVRFIALFTLLFFAIPKSYETVEIQTPLELMHFSKNGMFVQYPNNAGYNLQEPILITFKFNYTLLLSGDIELNPGPQEEIKSIRGSFHQGNSKFGETAGIQCSSNCFFAICYAQLRKLSLWKTHDLDYVLNQGDFNFKNLGITRQSPLIEEFQKEVTIGNSICSLDFNIVEGYFEDEGISVNFVNEELLLQHSGAVLVIAGNCLGVMRYNEKFFIFDSHSRDAKGHQVPGETGTSVLLQFRDITEIKDYIRSEYRANLFNVIYLKTNFHAYENTKSVISNEVRCWHKKASRKRKFEQLRGSEKHEQQKEKMRKAAKSSRELNKGSD